VLATATAGCLDDLLGEETFEATAASVSESALSETGYEEHRTDSVELERTFEAGGESETVTLTNWHAEYDRAVDLTLHVSEAVESGSDLLVAVGGYPTLVGDLEREHVFTMMDGVTHDG